jgi:hypothetical protein
MATTSLKALFDVENHAIVAHDAGVGTGRFHLCRILSLGCLHRVKPGI